MTVFKGYMKIVRKNMGLILLYFAIFMGITILYQHFSRKDVVMDYRTVSVRIAVIDEDGGSLAKGLREYLGQFHEVSEAENNKSWLQEELFYRNVEYIVWIPEHFFDTCVGEGKELAVTKVPGSYTAFYVDQQINSYLNDARTCYAAGLSQEETAQSLAKLETAQVELLDTGRISGQRPAYGFYFQYMPYLFLSALCYVIGNVLTAFGRDDLPKRMLASAVPARRQSLEGLLAAGVVGLGLWGVTVTGAFIWYYRNLKERGGGIYFLLNTLLMMLVALSISYLIGMLVHGKKAVNMLDGVVNVLSVGMSSLCGVFVPLELLSKGVRTVAQFLPVYWYEVVNGLLVEYGTVTGEVKQAVLQGLGMQFVFVVALVSVVMVLAKRKRV